MQNETESPDKKTKLLKATSSLLGDMEISKSFLDNSFSTRPKLDYSRKTLGSHEDLSMEKTSPEKFLGRQASFGPCLDGTESRISISHYVNPGIQYENLETSNNVANNEANNEALGFIASRFQHVITEEGHAVITRGKLLRCEDEPIHTPEAIQSFGLLIALKETPIGKLEIRIVSENSAKIIGYTPPELFQLDCFTDIFTHKYSDILFDNIKLTRDLNTSDYGPEVFTLSIKLPSSKKKENQILWCAMHIHPSQSDLIVCEFELDNDSINPLFSEDNIFSELPEDTLNSFPNESDFAESTIPGNKPLRINRISRKHGRENSAIDMSYTISQVLEQLTAAPDSDSFCKILAGIVKELTGFHRVMIYQFDASYNGRVVSEVVDPRVTHDLYRGLNFPASDIPPQARQLYQTNKVVVLYDRESITARLIYRSRVDLENPLDLSYSYLRAISPIHIKYLNNMAVRSSMSMSINSLNRLWGIIACHAYGSKGTRVSFPMRQMFRIIGNAASRNVERLFCVSRLHTRKLFSTSPSKKNSSELLITSPDDLLQIFNADFCLLSIQGVNKILGSSNNPQEAFDVQKYFETRKVTSILSSQNIRSDFPDLESPSGFNNITGLLVVPLSTSGNDFILLFRKEQIQEVRWAGNPHDKLLQDVKDIYLAPRKSFKVWTEKVAGKSREWTDEEVEAAVTLCSMYGKFIEVWRQNEDVLPKDQLTKLLLANSAHELRTPLNAIINYLEIAMEAPLDQETKNNLGQSCYASKSLIYVVNDLLDLTKTEQGHELVRDDIFDLYMTVEEVMASLGGDAKRKGLNYQAKLNTDVPQFVLGDRPRLKQVLINLIANAIQFTTQGFVRIQILLQSRWINGARIEIKIEDSGYGMSNQEIEEMFRDLDNVIIDSDLVDENREIFGNFYPSRSKSQKLGLGLATVLRIVRIMNGKLRIKSEKGKGTRFIIELNFKLPDLDDFRKLNKERFDSQSTSISKPSEMHKILTHEYIGSQLAENKLSTSNTENTERDHCNSERKVEVKSSSKNFIVSERSKLKLMKPKSNQKIKRGSDEYDFEILNNTNSWPQNLTMIQSPDINRTINESISCLTDNQSNNASNTSLKKVGAAMPKEVTRIEDVGKLQVLLAEDDFVNCKIIHKRLGKSGHKVYQTVNGGECADIYAEKREFFDVILMDIQMPFVDGMKATKMIRSFEKTCTKNVLSKHAISNGRVPIFAVSASLSEAKRQTYIDTGFDGWIMKPIDFDRLNILLRGIVETSARESYLYSPGKWEKGGWFSLRRSN
ncbi:Phytochrome-like protein cph1 [Erysiphe neolycopersici]|uniref:Phytochrome-like protein cph1 n=1 Tax=Erysiphe neolycopersici TaxID=212602 RepID=A0A420I505_9PEZI|nr:Phytochrome-like protein cph1 [Erysiphe neolycopersici]